MELSDQNAEENVFEKVKFKRNKQEIEGNESIRFNKKNTDGFSLSINNRFDALQDLNENTLQSLTKAKTIHVQNINQSGSNHDEINIYTISTYEQKNNRKD